MGTKFTTLVISQQRRTWEHNTKAQIDQKITDGNGTKITAATTAPSAPAKGEVWIKI